MFTGFVRLAGIPRINLQLGGLGYRFSGLLGRPAVFVAGRLQSK
jgi:hypothetical protein